MKVFLQGLLVGALFCVALLPARGQFINNPHFHSINAANLNLANYNNLPSVNTLKEAVTSGLRDNPTPSDYWLENASYMRLESLTLSYNLPKIKGIENMRLYVSGNNLFVILF